MVALVSSRDIVSPHAAPLSLQHAPTAASTPTLHHISQQRILSLTESSLLKRPQSWGFPELKWSALIQSCLLWPHASQWGVPRTFASCALKIPRPSLDCCHACYIVAYSVSFIKATKMGWWVKPKVFCEFDCKYGPISCCWLSAVYFERPKRLIWSHSWFIAEPWWIHVLMPHNSMCSPLHYYILKYFFIFFKGREI